MIPVHRPYFGQEELDALRGVLESRWVGRGPLAETFEARLRELLDARHVLAVSTGTAALHLALAALDLEPGDEVVAPSLVFVGAAQAILAAGGRPVFCEVEPETLNMDVQDALRRVTARTRAILPVHYGGRPCDLDALVPAAHARGIRVVDDAAHAFGSTYQGRHVGTLTDLACFSFDPIKTVTCGDGGAIATEDDDLARRIVLSRNVGIEIGSWGRQRATQHWQYQVATPGYRYDLSDVHAAIGLAQLDRLDAMVARRQALARRYDAALQGVDGIACLAPLAAGTVPFSYVVRVLNDRRDALARSLRERDIGTTVQFIPNHLQSLFAAPDVRLPVTEQLGREILTLPLYYEMTDADLDSVVDAIRAFSGAESGSAVRASNTPSPRPSP